MVPTIQYYFTSLAWPDRFFSCIGWGNSLVGGEKSPHPIYGKKAVWPCFPHPIHGKTRSGHARLLSYCMYSDIMFFIKSYKQQSSHFNITEYVQFSSSNTHFGLSKKMIHHRCSSSIAWNFYFHRLSRIWNSLPKIDLSLSTNTIKHKLYNFLWDHFKQHYLCPCCHCSTVSPSPIYEVLL